MTSNTNFPLRKEYDTLSVTVIKIGGDLDDTKQALVTTNDTVVKEGNNDMDDK